MRVILRRFAAFLLLTASLGIPAAAQAQITVAPAPGVWGGSNRNSAAFHPANDIYLVIVAAGEGPVTGRFINKSGNQVGPDFGIQDEPGYSGWVSIAAGGPPNDPTFVVTYIIADNALNSKYARFVRFGPGGQPTVSQAYWITNVFNEWYAAEKAQNVWNGQQWVIGTRVIAPGWSLPGPQVNLLDMSGAVSAPVQLADGQDYYGSPAVACAADGVCLTVGFLGGATGGGGGTYGRRFDGATLTPLGTLFYVGIGNHQEEQAVVYQKHTGLFLTQWVRTGGGYVDTRLVAPGGSLGTTNTAAGPNGGTTAISYNQFTQTTLLTTKDSLATLFALELGDNGTPIRPANLVTITPWDGAVPDYLPSLAANEENGQWLLVYRLAPSSYGSIVTGTYVDPTTVPLAITTNGTLPPATDTLPYAQLLLASGGVIPHTWTLVSGALPPGLNLNGAYLNGTPTTPGAYAFRLRVTSTDLQVAEQDFTLFVQAIIAVPPGGWGASITGGTGLFMSPGRAYRNNLAYDPVNQVYLMITGAGGDPVSGRWLNKNGIPIAPDFPISSEEAFTGWVSIAFGGPANDPTFLVTYLISDNVLNPKYSRFVRFAPGGQATVSQATWIANTTTEWFSAEKSQSAWNGQQWVVGTRVIPPGWSLPSPQMNLLDPNGTLSPPVHLGDGQDYYGSPALACAADGVCLTVGFIGGIPLGVAGGTYARRFNATTLAPLGNLFYLSTGSRNEDQGVVYQAHTGRFLAQWLRGSGPGLIDTRLVGTDGSMSLLDLSRGIGPFSGGSMIVYNPGTQTTLLATKWEGANLVAMELGDDGYPLNLNNIVIVTNYDGTTPDYWAWAAANPADRQWLVTANLSAGLVGRVIQGSVPGTGYPIQNWSFSEGMTGWSQFGLPNPSDVVVTTTNGVLEFYRQAPPPGQSGQGVVLQSLGIGFPAGAPIAADFDLGNSSTVRKRIAVLLHDLNFSDLQMCTFWLDPGAPLRTYRIRTYTNRPWANATIAFYAATPGSDGGAYRIDNVEVYALPGQAIDRTECVDPTTPAPVALPDGGTMIVNGDFSSGLAPWGTFGQITSQISGGVFQFARPAGEPVGVVLQATGVAQPNDTRLSATFSLGNSSGARRRVTVLIHDGDFSDLAACAFWLEPGLPLSTYQMKLFTTKSWANATFSVYPANVDESQWILLDNVSLAVTPSAPLMGTECIVPPPPAPGSAATQARSSAARASGAAGIATPGYGDDQPIWRAVAAESGTQAYLWRAPIDLREANQPRLRFDSQLSDGTSEAFVEVTRDGVTWIRVAAISPSDDWAAVTIDLSEFEGDIIYVRFVYRGAELAGGAAVESFAIRAVRVDGRTPRTRDR